MINNKKKEISAPADLVLQGFNLLLLPFQLCLLPCDDFLLLSQFSLDIIFLGCHTGVKFLQLCFTGKN